MMKWLAVGLVLLVVSVILMRPSVTAPGDDADRLPTVERVIQRYIDALGGRDAIGSLSTRVCIGRLVTDLSGMTPCYEEIPLVACSMAPSYLLMIERTSGGLRCEASDGKATWVQDPAGIELRQEPIETKLAWLFDPQGALRLEDYFPGLEVTSIEVISGNPAYLLEPAELKKAHHALYFDVGTGLLARVGYFWEYHDYREVDGVMFPFRVSVSRKGGSSTYVFDLVKHNLPLDASLFAAPATAGTRDE